MAGDEAGSGSGVAGGPPTGATPPSAPPPMQPPPPPPPPPGAWTAPSTNTYVPGAPPVAPPTGLSALGTAAQVLFGLMGLVSLLSIGLNLTYASEVDSFAVDRTNLDRVESLENQIAGLAGLYLLGLIVAAVVYLIWQARVRQAGEALGARGFRHSRGMAIGGWFIPFANLVIPKRAVDDLWRATDPEPSAGFDITGRPVAGLVSGWWALWLISNVVSADFGDHDTLAEIASSARRGAFADVLGFAAAVCAVLLVRRLTTRAQDRASRLGVPLA